MLSVFEEKHKKIYSLKEEQELKSDIIKQKNYKYGLSSFNKNAFNLYCDFFDIMNRINPILHFSIMSKMEFLIRSIFIISPYSRLHIINEELFYYSLIKFFVVYGNKELFSSLYYASDPKSIMILKDELIEHLNSVINAINGIGRKKREEIAFQTLVVILSECTIELRPRKIIEYDYSPNFEGLRKLIKELGLEITETTILMDNDEGTYLASCRFQFESVLQFDSKVNIQIRASDLLAGFIGRMIYAISNDETIKEDSVNDIKMIAENDLSTKRLISKEWFDVNESQFKLYRIIYELIVDKQQNHWSIMTMIYSDKLISFISLIRYFKHYDTFEKFKQVDLKMHTEYYNKYVCHELEEHYKL